MSTNVESASPEPQEAPSAPETTTVHFYAPVHIDCPARPHQAAPANFYLVEGAAEKIWACEACAAIVRLEVRVLDVTAPVEQLAAAAEALMARPAQTLGPRALLYDAREETYRVGGLDRRIKAIGCEVQGMPPDREKPLSTWGVSKYPGTPLALDERLAVSAFMAGRWWAWAHAAVHDQVVHRPGPSRIVRPH